MPFNLNANGSVIWITGLSDSGKTTLSKLLSSHLKYAGYSTILLDGHDVREVFGDTAFDKQTRMANSMRTPKLAKLLSYQGHIVVVATISMFKEVYEWNRNNLPNYFEVYLDIPLEELKRRDSKGIYKAYDDGTIQYVFGLDVPADIPYAPDYVVKYDPRRSIEDDLQGLLNALNRRIGITLLK